MIDVEELDEQEIARALAIAKIGNPMQRVKNGGLGNVANVRLNQEETVVNYHSKHWSSVVTDRPKEVPVSEILEVRSGWHTDNFQKISSDQTFCQNVSESRCFSIIFRHPYFLIKAIDLVAETPEVQEVWIIALRYLANKIKKETHYFNEERWLKEHFEKADKNKNGSLSFKELWQLLETLNLELNERHAKTLFQNADFRKSDNFFGEEALDFDEFLVFFRSMTQRTEIKSLMTEYSSIKRDMFTVEDLKNFLENVQKHPPITEDECKKFIQEFEPEPPYRESGILSSQGFLKFLLSDWCNVFDQKYNYVYQDMTQPLTDYFINSSHNTYLIGHQLKGDASIEAYISALKKGVRVLEFDIWDSSPEPIVTHGHTLVNPIRLRDATKAVNSYAFYASKYPIILSLEVHCSLNNQKVIANIFKEIFGDKIYIPPKNLRQLPSPEELKEKILLKGWKIPSFINAPSWTPEETDLAENDPDHEVHKIVEDEVADAAEQHKSISKVYSDLISLPIQIIKDIAMDIVNHPFNGVANFSEKKMPEPSAPNYDNYVRYANKHLVRVYPFGLRTDSSNLNPIRFWNAGLQIATLNVQHADLSNDLNDGLFLLNGGCGYVLKPEMLRKGNFNLFRVSGWPHRKIFNVTVISAQYLPKPNTDNDIIDPYVVIEIYGMDCDKQTFKTKVVKNNGFNPAWNEKFEIKLKAPEFAFIRFVVFDYDKFSSDDFVGEFTLPVTGLKEGYSYVHLRTGYAHLPDPSAAVFVHVETTKSNESDLMNNLTVNSLSCLA